MKLISCYIENFGGLSQFSQEFSDGVTVIQEPNGFGKTTLAEFLRAMFYGFPRKAKTLDKSKRQKYTPWNGGKFGGNLVFEHEGVRYRLERTFGATPRGDTFTLMDLSTNKKCDRFSEEIGLELFQLDADSFERSTYMPQLRDNTTLTTAGIQAKLGDLVEDTNDLGNFDKAMQMLKTGRSAFVPYRGSGGSVAEAVSHVTRLQQELDRTKSQRDELRQCEEDIACLKALRQQKEERAEAVRQQISAAAEAAVRAEKRKQYADLCAQHDAVAAELASLREQYPKGIPDRREIEAAQQIADRMAALSAREITTQADQEAAAFLKENAKRFEGRIPSSEELEKAAQQCEAYGALLAEGRNLGLTDGEANQLEALAPVFESGLMDEEKLDALAQRNRQMLKYQAALESLAVPEEDRRQMAKLSSFFASGVPTEVEIKAQSEALDECQALRQENAELAAIVPRERKNNPLPMILAAVLGVAGIVLLVLRSFVLGGVLLGAGVVALAAALVQNSARKKNNLQLSKIQKKTEENEKKAASLQQSVREFTKAYTRTEPLADALSEICRSREMYLALAEKLRVSEEKCSALEGVMAAENAALCQELEPYFGKVTDFDKAISHLRVARGQYLDLREKARAAEEKAERLHVQLAAIREELSAFLGRFYEEITPDRFSAALSALQRDADAYVRAKTQIHQQQEREETRERELRQGADDLAAFFSRFGLTQPEDVRQQLQQLRDDGKAQQDALLREKQMSLQLARFREEDTGILEESAEQEWDTESLKDQDKRLAAELSDLNRQLLQQEHNAQNLRLQVDRLPQIQDELESWQEKRCADQKKARILDDTMLFLQKARDSLTTSYLGPIRESFGRYLEKLTQVQGEKIFISPDLDVQLERFGQARELAYFSAGQTDAIMLCMRLALVDALFRDVKPFVILDDPFVNLDDQRTVEALELLQELGKDRQIIYLTCNSSRSL